MFIQIYRIWKRKRGRDANLRSLPDSTVGVITYKHKKKKHTEKKKPKKKKNCGNEMKVRIITPSTSTFGFIDLLSFAVIMELIHIHSLTKNTHVCILVFVNFILPI